MIALLPFVFLHTFAVRSLAATHETLMKPECASDRFDLSSVAHGLTILSIEAKEQNNYTSFGAGPAPAQSGLNFCQIQIYLTHQTKDDVSRGILNTKDRVLVEVWLPLSSNDWNGRFQATGGAGFQTGMFDAQLGIAVKNGWAAVSTDGGHAVDLQTGTGDGSWALNEDKSINWYLLQNFASRSIVDQIHVGKSITEQYYGVRPHHSYWNGCSTGGRQGYAIAQRYPHLVDGILANAPAISFTRLVIANFWPQLRMRMTDTYMTKCELDYYRARTVESCDKEDGLYDGILEDPDQCHFSPHILVQEDETFVCDGKEVKFTKAMAELISDIHYGPGSSNKQPLFPGFRHGVPMDTIAGITISGDGTRSQNPFPISVSWLKQLVLKDPTYNLSNIAKLSEFYDLLGQAAYEYGGILDDDNPDLSALQASGTKMITWHGLYDQMIPFQNSVNYRRKVDGVMGGAQKVDDYFRLFLAPGVEHCGGGIGPLPKDPLEALIDWVENNLPPEVLEAETIDYEGDLVTRELCAWPAKSKYMGIGSAKRASSWSCVGGTDRSATAEDAHEFSPAQQVMSDMADRLQGLGLGLSIG